MPIALALTLLLALPAEEKDPALRERARFQGQWKAVVVEHAGQRAPEEAIQDWKLTIQGSRMTATYGNMRIDESTFEVDPSSKPGSIYITWTAGPEKGKRVRGIYEFQDAGRLRICYSDKGKFKVSGFASREGTDLTLVILRRIKP